LRQAHIQPVDTALLRKLLLFIRLSTPDEEVEIMDNPLLDNALGVLLSFVMNYPPVVDKLAEWGAQDVLLAFVKALLSRDGKANSNMFTAVCILALSNVRLEGDMLVVVVVLMEGLKTVGNEYAMLNVMLSGVASLTKTVENTLVLLSRDIMTVLCPFIFGKSACTDSIMVSNIFGNAVSALRALISLASSPQLMKKVAECDGFAAYGVILRCFVSASPPLAIPSNLFTDVANTILSVSSLISKVDNSAAVFFGGDLPAVLVACARVMLSRLEGFLSLSSEIPHILYESLKRIFRIFVRAMQSSAFTEAGLACGVVSAGVLVVEFHLRSTRNNGRKGSEKDEESERLNLEVVVDVLKLFLNVCNDGVRRIIESNDQSNVNISKCNFHRHVFDECNGVGILFILFDYYSRLVDKNPASGLSLLVLKYSSVIICSLHWQMDMPLEYAAVLGFVQKLISSGPESRNDHFPSRAAAVFSGVLNRENLLNTETK
jgi:hypothetical protein